MKDIQRYLILILLVAAPCATAFGQVSISGPTCVVAGTIYQYKISGNWDAAATMQVCLNAGTIADAKGSNNCTDSGSAPLATVLVIWNDSASNTGSITVSSSKGNAFLSINFTEPLLPGAIDSLSRSQIVPAGSVPSTIFCSVDTGGSCNPSYAHQWQQSDDMVSWKDVSGANGLNLSFAAPIGQTAFFRRKAIEAVSGTIGYSDIAVVNVMVSGAAYELQNNGPLYSTMAGEDAFATTNYPNL